MGVSYPTTYYPESLQDVEKLKNLIEYPTFVKPYSSHIWQLTYPNKGFVVRAPSQLVEKFKEVFASGLQAMVQTVITGPDSNIVEVYAYMSQDHVPLATFVTRKLRQYPNGFGVGTCLESIHAQNVLDAGLKFLQGIDYVGLCSMEFKRDLTEGEYKLLELNARLATHNMQATRAGINFPLLQYMDLSGEPVAKFGGYADGIIWLDLIPDFLALNQLNQSVVLSFVNWLKTIRASDCQSYFAPDDIRPFIRNSIMELSSLPWYLLRRGGHN